MSRSQDAVESPRLVESPCAVAVFVGTRADLGPLLPVIAELDARDDVEVTVLTGVAYAAADLAAALPPSTREWRDRVRALAPPMTTVDQPAQLHCGPQLADGAARELVAAQIEVLVVLGDRWELLSVVPPAALLGVRIVHLHGGEVTEGAIDERVRHAITKLADQHCVASADAADRVAQLGEPRERIHLTGAPGLDRLAAARPLSDDELRALVRRFVPSIPDEAIGAGPRALFTYHPPTVDRSAPVGDWAAQALAATLDRCGLVIATHPGMDPGREAILAALSEAAATNARLVVVPALGADYPRMLHTVDVVVGNSSSGIIEAASAGRPAVDVGARQQGRLRGANVVTVGEGFEAVAAGLDRALAPDFVQQARHTDNPYGTGQAAAAIADVVAAAPRAGLVKAFVDRREVA